MHRHISCRIPRPRQTLSTHPGVCVQPSEQRERERERKKHTCDSRTTLLHREITRRRREGRRRDIASEGREPKKKKLFSAGKKQTKKKKKSLTTDHGWFVFKVRDRDHRLFQPFFFWYLCVCVCDSFKQTDTQLSWLGGPPIFALDSVNQVKNVWFSTFVCYMSFSEFFVWKLILLDDTHREWNDRV